MKGGSVLVLGGSVVKAGVVDLLKRLSPGVLVLTTVLSLIVLSLVLRLLVSKMLLMVVVMTWSFVVQIASPVTFNETLETSVDEVNVTLTLDAEITILVHLSALQSPHETFGDLRVFTTELSCSKDTGICWSCAAFRKTLHAKSFDCFEHEI